MVVIEPIVLPRQAQNAWGRLVAGHDDVIPLKVALYIYDVVVRIVPDWLFGISVVECKGELLASEAIVVGVEAIVNVPCAFKLLLSNFYH